MNPLIRHSLILALCLPLALWAQDDSAPGRKNSFELFLPVSHFFDGSLTNWTIFVPKVKLRRYPDGRVSARYYTGLPSTFGASYIRNVGKKTDLCLSATSYSIEHPNEMPAPGETTYRLYGLFSAESLREFLYIPRWRLRAQALGAAEFRLGREMIVLLSNRVEQIEEDLEYRDWGLSAGLRLTHALSNRFFLAAEARYSRFIFLYYKEEYPDPDDEYPTPHALTLKYSIGVRF